MSEFLNELSDDLEKLLDQEESYDVIIKVGEGNNSREFKVHSLILKARCAYFQSAFSNNWVRRGEGGIINFNKPNISPKVFENLLKYLYTGKIDLNKQGITEILQILVAADELNLQNLTLHAEKYLLESPCDILRKDSIKILQIIFKNETCAKLRDYCVEMISEDPNVLFGSKEFLTMDKSILMLLLQRDDLNMEEIDIWENLTKWGVSQINNQERTISNLSVENLYNLKELMQEFIPLIRWVQINSNEFRRKVMPFKKIIPKDLYKDILCHHLDSEYELNIKVLPPRIPLKFSILDSILIEQRHITIFSSWIDKQEMNFYDRKRVPYSFKLLYRASKDGFEAEKFHQLCDNRGPTVTVAKIFSDGQLIGGYNPLDWKPQSKLSSDSCWYSTFDSFLFSFTSSSLNNNSNPKVARVGNSGNISEYAIGYNTGYGPSFGGGWDLSIQNNNLIYSYGPYSYPDCGNFVTKNQYLELEDYEVFQIIKKN